MDIRAILVPFDFSEYSEKAFRWALAMAERWSAQLRLLHVVSLPSYPPNVLGMHFNVANLEAGLRADAESRLQEFVSRVGSSTVPIDTRVIRGEPAADLRRMAEQENVDVIVMGSHGRTGLAHVLLGSVAERVVRSAPCSVLVVGRQAHV
jgi:nucleotide-binding universal stress UspA family protein